MDRPEPTGVCPDCDGPYWDLYAHYYDCRGVAEDDRYGRAREALDDGVYAPWSVAW